MRIINHFACEQRIKMQFNAFRAMLRGAIGFLLFAGSGTVDGDRVLQPLLLRPLEVNNEGLRR